MPSWLRWPERVGMEIDLSRLIDALPGLMWTATPDGEAEIVGSGWLEYTGLSAEDAAGVGWQQALHPNDRVRLLEEWSAIIASEQPGDVEARLRRHDGVFRRFLFRASPLRDEAGRVERWCGITTDIEDRISAEEALREQQRNYQDVIDGLPAYVTLFGRDGSMVYANQWALDYHGLTLEQLKASSGCVHPDDWDETMALWYRSIADGQPYESEARLLRREGVYRWNWVRGLPLHDADGRIEFWYGACIDIHEMKNAQAQLAAEKRLLQRVAEGAPLLDVTEALCREVEALAPGCLCGILLLTDDKQYLCIGGSGGLPNAYNAAMDGLSIDPHHGPCFLAVATKSPVIVEDTASDPRWQGSTWLTLVREHGLASCWSTPILSAKSDVLGSFAIFRQLPAVPEAAEVELVDRFTRIARIAIERSHVDAALLVREAELSQANSFLTEAQRVSQTGSFTWDVQADEHRWSDEIYRIFEFQPGEKVTTPMILAAIHPDDLSLVETAIGDAIKGVPFDLVFRIVSSTGATRFAHAVAHPIEPKTDQPVFLGALQDITQRKVAEDALNRARSELAHVSRLTTLSALTASIAHEINQPLAGILTNASTCLRMLAADPPNLEGAKATAQRTIRDGNRTSDVIQRLRALFTQKAPASELVDLNDAAREVVAISNAELHRARVVLRLDLDDTLPAVTGDLVQLQQVILNLLQNGADAMSEVEDRPRELVVTTGREKGSRVRLSVCDVGIGIPSDATEKLFEAFHTTKPNGMGIGLSISRSIIESHEGRLWVEPNDGPGATFVFSIPAALEATADPIQSAPAPSRADAPFRRTL